MGRMVRPVRVKEGRSMGERGSEIIVFLVIIAGLIWAARWYFVVYKNSPTVALMNYVGAVKSSDVDLQYSMLSSSTKKSFPDKATYIDRWKMARGLQGRLVDYTITKITEKGNKAEANVSVAIRKPSQEIYQAAATSVVDHYVLVKEGAGWRIALDQCFNDIKTKAFAEDYIR
jgi:hypothetical protein